MSGRVIWSDGETELIERRLGRLTVTGDGEGVSVTADALRGMVAALDAGEAGEDGALKPCPFCGGRALTNSRDYVWEVHCPRCQYSFGVAEEECGAAEQWNRRAPQPSPAAALVEALRALVESVESMPGEFCATCGNFTNNHHAGCPLRAAQSALSAHDAAREGRP